MDRRSRSVESRHYKRRRKSRSRSSSRGRRDRGYSDRDKYDRDRYDRGDRDRRRRRSRSRSKSRSRERVRRGHDHDRDLYREIIGQDHENYVSSRERERTRRRSKEDDRSYERSNRPYNNKRHNSPDKETHSDSNESNDGYEQQNSYSNQPQRIIIIRGLSLQVTESDIRSDLLQCHLTPSAIRLIRKKKTGVPRGFAFVDFATQDEAIRWMSYRQGYLDLPNCRAKMQYSQPLIRDQKFLSDWYCVKCGVLNFRRRELCFKCYASREESEKGGEGSDEVSNILTKKIMLRNLDVLTTEESVATVMQEKIPQQVAKVTKILICRDPLTQTSRGICYLYFDNLIDSMNTHNALKTLDPPLNIDDREVLVTYCVDSENKQILPKPSKSSTRDPIPKYTANTYQYTLADVPRLAEYSASMYASSAAEKEHYIKYYTNYYIAEISKGQYGNLPTMHQLGETSANSGAAVALSAIQRKLGKSVKSNSTTGKNFNKTYPMPDITTYQYDETSGYYYDPLTKLYYDPHSQYYYDNETGSYMYYDQEQRKYVVAPTASQAAVSTTTSGVVVEASASTQLNNTGGSNESEIKPKEELKKDAKHDKVKVAKKIVKDMEKWAKQLNQKKEMTHFAPTSSATPAAAPVATPVIDVKRSQQLSSKYADVGFSILEGKEKPIINSTIETELSNRVVQTYNSDSDEQEEHNNHQNNSSEYSSEKDYVDYEKLTCLLCKRAFQSQEILNKHLKMSKLHKDNLAKYNLNKSLNNETNFSQEYRDRAKERRLKFGESDPPPVNRSKERFEKELESVSISVQSQLGAMPISENNVGNRLLQKMGWQEGQGLGKSNQGRTNIIEADGRSSTAGLGSKVSQFGPGDDYKSYIKRMMKSRYESVDTKK
ncbi:RNA-binding protein 5-like [Condylostylus longicornis]|uniref:RNA-binding protein 5-like n=1 Tax=Condylostylus longicornis TaxID=2530218 RepID=UPI00244E22FD|nr:RNA-binding protein 5-like [Condylostylus longicornis]